MVTPKKIIIKDLELADEEIARLRKENKELKANYKKALSDVVTLTKENKELKERLALTENDRDEWQLKTKDLLKENKELKAKNRALELRIEKALVFNI